MEIEEVNVREVQVLKIHGDFLGEHDPSIFKNRVGELANHGCKHIIIDLEPVHYINSFGLGSLVAAFTTMKRVGGDVRLANVCSAVQKLLEITRLVKVFEVYDTVESALANTQKSSG